MEGGAKHLIDSQTMPRDGCSIGHDDRIVLFAKALRDGYIATADAGALARKDGGQPVEKLASGHRCVIAQEHLAQVLGGYFFIVVPFHVVPPKNFVRTLTAPTPYGAGFPAVHFVKLNGFFTYIICTSPFLYFENHSFLTKKC